LATGLRARARAEGRRTAVAAAQLVLFIGCLVLTGSRAGLLLTAVASGIFIVWETSNAGHARRRAVFAAAGAALAVAGLALVVFSRTSERFGGLAPDVSIRGQIFAVHWRAFLDAPIAGYGLGGFSDLNNAVMTPETFDALAPIRAAHNVYLQWLVEGGLLLAAPMFLAVGIVLLLSLRGLGADAGARTLTRGLACASLLVLGHGGVDISLQFLAVSTLWAFLLGLALAIGRSASLAPLR
jgi:O-antigen ligase